LFWAARQNEAALRNANNKLQQQAQMPKRTLYQ
jgi:hypothetical protein